jgi:ATP-dependent Clp protease ATP-binding subunit ClpC
VSDATHTPLNPIAALSTLLLVFTAVIGLNRLSVWIPPALFVLSLLGMVTVTLLRRRSGRRGQLRVGLDHQMLQARPVAHLLPWLKDQVRGHGPIIDTIFSELERNLRLAKPGRPLGAFLLVGPTGTGKTFLAQLIAEGLFPDSPPVVLRMNQYKLAQDVYTLMGPPPGVPGFEIGGALTRPVLENPYRVVVFDEIEKAHPDVHHCLYDVLDVASCREKSSGKTVDFSGTVFFATCNAAVDELRAVRRGKADAATWQAKSRDALADAAGFDRAFLARWTGIYLMDELAPVHIAEVACQQLARHWKEYGMDVAYASPEVLLSAVQGNEEFRQYGVRQLGTYLRERTRDAIIDAKGRGAKTVWLGANEAGELTVTEMRREAGLHR